jgi:hypothetical protein
MKSQLLVMALAGIVLPLAGCESVADTAPENEVRVKHAMLLNMKQITNDVEYVLYIDRPVWLSRYPIPND